MTPSPSPTPLDVFVHTGPAEWWQILAALGPLAVLLGAGIAGFVGWSTLRQKAQADNRSEWWKRTQWALDAVQSNDKKRGTVGLKVLKVLGESDLAGPGELAVLEAAWEKPLDSAERKLIAKAQGVAGGEAFSLPVASGGAAHSVDVRDGVAEGVVTAPDEQPGVDGGPEPRDNGEDEQPRTTGGGSR